MEAFYFCFLLFLLIGHMFKFISKYTNIFLSLSWSDWLVQFFHVGKHLEKILFKIIINTRIRFFRSCYQSCFLTAGTRNQGLIYFETKLSCLLFFNSPHFDKTKYRNPKSQVCKNITNKIFLVLFAQLLIFSLNIVSKPMTRWNMDRCCRDSETIIKFAVFTSFSLWTWEGANFYSCYILSYEHLIQTHIYIIPHFTLSNHNGGNKEVSRNKWRRRRNPSIHTYVHSDIAHKNKMCTHFFKIAISLPLHVCIWQPNNTNGKNGQKYIHAYSC